jgi:arylsulfatase A-like enzyme
VYVDDLGWRDLGVQGSEFYETPNVDRLAAEGVRFTNAYANAPNCAPSRAALMSGVYAPRTGIYTVGTASRGQSALRKLVPVENETELSLDVVTLAEALQAAGYRTGHAGKWHLGGEGRLPTDQGFDWAVAGDETGTPRAYFYPYRDRSGAGIPPASRASSRARRASTSPTG